MTIKHRSKTPSSAKTSNKTDGKQKEKEKAAKLQNNTRSMYNLKHELEKEDEISEKIRRLLS